MSPREWTSLVEPASLHNDGFPTETTPAVSIAISLKRIADSLERGGKIPAPDRETGAQIARDYLDVIRPEGTIR